MLMQWVDQRAANMTSPSSQQIGYDKNFSVVTKESNTSMSVDVPSVKKRWAFLSLWSRFPKISHQKAYDFFIA